MLGFALVPGFDLVAHVPYRLLETKPRISNTSSTKFTMHNHMGACVMKQ
jgi:hypothetical protein